VARDDEVFLLDRRAAARTHYAAVVAAAGDWQLPEAIRDAMRAWQFDDAERLLTDAESVLADRSAVAAEAAAAGLTVPDTLRIAFEDSDSLAPAAIEIDAQRDAIARITAADAARPARTDPVMDIGLWGTDPEADLTKARSRFASGDLAGATASAGHAASAWSNAGDVGRGRVLSLVLLAVAILFAVVLGAVWYRSHRRARAATITTADADA
jgi:hypothetical protein